APPEGGDLMSPIDGVRSLAPPQCDATRLEAFRSWNASRRSVRVSAGEHRQAACCDLRSIRRVKAEFASCRAPQSARALWPLWPDFRLVPPMLTARAHASYAWHRRHTWAELWRAGLLRPICLAIGNWQAMA